MSTRWILTSERGEREERDQNERKSGHKDGIMVMGDYMVGSMNLLLTKTNNSVYIYIDKNITEVDLDEVRDKIGKPTQKGIKRHVIGHMLLAGWGMG